MRYWLQGRDPFMAPLTGPNATSNTAVEVGVDKVLQFVALSVLRGISSDFEDKLVQLKAIAVAENDVYARDGIIASLEYLRDRIGVPRDIRYPAARQLRAHLNWAIKILN